MNLSETSQFSITLLASQESLLVLFCVYSREKQKAWQMYFMYMKKEK